MKRKKVRDPGLLAAVDAAGGIGKLAHLLNLRQPSVSVWRRIPSHRILQVEAATGVDRAVLRPDLYDRGTAPCIERAEPDHPNNEDVNRQNFEKAM